MEVLDGGFGRAACCWLEDIGLFGDSGGGDGVAVVVVSVFAAMSKVEAGSNFG